EVPDATVTRARSRRSKRTGPQGLEFLGQSRAGPGVTTCADRQPPPPDPPPRRPGPLRARGNALDRPPSRPGPQRPPPTRPPSREIIASAAQSCPRTPETAPGGGLYGRSRTGTAHVPGWLLVAGATAS